MTVENLLSSVEQISKGTESLKHMVTESSGTIEEMMRTVQEVANKIGDAKQIEPERGTGMQSRGARVSTRASRACRT